MVTDASVLAGADARRNQALSILNRLDLLRRWSAVGSVEIVGSVALNVVVKPDIDLAIYVDDFAPQRGFDALVPLAEDPGVVHQIGYTDARQWSMHGLYWKIETIEDDGEEWTIDNWVLTRDRERDSQDEVARATRGAAEAIRRRPDARATIIRIKQAAIDLGQPAYGRWLYEAVLDDGVKTYDDYVNWMGDQDPFERSTWMPKDIS